MPPATVVADRNTSGAARTWKPTSSARSGCWITASTSSRSNPRRRAGQGPRKRLAAVAQGDWSSFIWISPSRQPRRCGLLLQKHPGHLGGSILMTRLVLDTEGPPAGVAQFQQALSARPVRKLAAARIVGLVPRLGPGPVRATPRRRSSTWSLPAVSQAAKTSRRRRLCILCDQIPRSPSGRRTRIVSGRHPSRLPRRSANRSSGRWVGPRKGSGRRPPRLSSCWPPVRAPALIADRNRGLCCLWLADHDGAVAALRRYIARTKPTTDTVDLEALCQKIEPPSRLDLVDLDQLSWPIRNREGLLGRAGCGPGLRRGASARHRDPDDPESPVGRAFSCSRSSRDRGQARPHPAGYSAGRSRGAR